MNFNFKKKVAKKVFLPLSAVGLAFLMILAANAEKGLPSPLQDDLLNASLTRATKTFELAYIHTLSDTYSVKPEASDSETDSPEINIRVLEDASNPQVASVVVNNQEVMKFRTAHDGLSPQLRAKRAANRLYAFLSVKGDARSIRPHVETNQANEAVIYIGDEVLANIDEQTAKASKNNVRHLAFIWSNLVRQSLGAHPLIKGPSEKSRSKINREAFIDPAAFKATGHALKGIASWYGPGFHGRTAADGSRYNMYELTAAHKSLPFGTLVKVKNLKNSKEVVVRITDRGPYVHGRVIDLSKAAAQAIDMAGVAPVVVQILAKDANYKIPAPQAQPPSMEELLKQQDIASAPEKQQDDVTPELDQTDDTVLSREAKTENANEPVVYGVQQDVIDEQLQNDAAARAIQTAIKPEQIRSVDVEPNEEEMINAQAVQEAETSEPVQPAPLKEDQPDAEPQAPEAAPDLESLTQSSVDASVVN